MIRPKNYDDFEGYIPSGDNVELGFTEDGASLEDLLALYLTDEDMREWASKQTHETPVG